MMFLKIDVIKRDGEFVIASADKVGETVYRKAIDKKPIVECQTGPKKEPRLYFTTDNIPEENFYKLIETHEDNAVKKFINGPSSEIKYY